MNQINRESRDFITTDVICMNVYWKMWISCVLIGTVQRLSDEIDELSYNQTIKWHTHKRVDEWIWNFVELTAEQMFKSLQRNLTNFVISIFGYIDSNSDNVGQANKLRMFKWHTVTGINVCMWLSYVSNIYFTFCLTIILHRFIMSVLC